MIEILAPEEIERLLQTNAIGRIGCYADGRTYVVPIAYAYEGGSVYGHSTEGLKIRMMRKNPSVCFETDAVDDVFNWRSIIAWGVFEQLHGAAAEDAMRTILLRFLETKIQPYARPLAPRRPGVGGTDVVVYRIRLIEKTGRYERTREASPV